MHRLGLRLNESQPQATGRTESIRRRLLALALLPLGVVLPLLLIILANWGSAYLDRLLIAKVGADLLIANSYFERVTAGIGMAVDGLASSSRLSMQLTAAGTNKHEKIHQWLEQEKSRLNLDFLHLLDLDGCARGYRESPCFNSWSVVNRASEGHSHTVNEIFSAAQLFAINPKLAERAFTPLIPTRGASPDYRQAEQRGLVVHTAAPVHDREGRLIGILAGGVLLNHNLEFIDQLNQIVYPNDDALPDSIGTATLFLDDVRIATNVRLFAGERAIGTRVSQTVRDAVLGAGKNWLNRAFVVQDWYFSAYRPLLNDQGERIGMLYVGFLEKPFATAKNAALLTIIGLFGLAMLLAAIFSVLWARKIFRPIERMHTTMHAIENGQADSRVGPVDSEDEIGELARHFDRLLEAQQAQAQALQRWAKSLDDKVAERTTALQEALGNLRTTQDQLITNEKMAAIGQLTAGVAHEINNPIAVIQGNLEIARSLLGEQAEPVASEFRLIADQVHRIRLIVTKLLQFARPQEYVGYLEPVSATQLIHDSLLLVGHLLRKGNVAIAQGIASNRLVNCNKTELQQVLINLISNAIQAMPDGGTLGLAVEDWDEADMPIGLRLSVTDSGPGIPAAERERLFKPFYTAHKPGGHGLGLWVSKSLVERYDGKITVHSEAGQGACFTLWLRCEPLG